MTYDWHKPLKKDVNRLFANNIKNVPLTLGNLGNFFTKLNREVVKAISDYENYPSDFESVFKTEFSKIESGSVALDYHYSVDRQDGTGDISIHWKGMGPGSVDDRVNNLYDAYIRSKTDVLNVHKAYEAMKKFVDVMYKLPNVANYAKDEYADPDEVNNLNSGQWSDSNGNKILSPKAIMKLYLRFAGLTTHCINAWFSPMAAIVDGIEEVYDDAVEREAHEIGMARDRSKYGQSSR